MSLIAREFRTLGELHHSISAQLENFPMFKLMHLSRVLSLMTKTFTLEESQQYSVGILERYKVYRLEVSENFLVTRMHFLELLLILVDVCYI